MNGKKLGVLIRAGVSMILMVAGAGGLVRASWLLYFDPEHYGSAFWICIASVAVGSIGATHWIADFEDTGPVVPVWIAVIIGGFVAAITIIPCTIGYTLSCPFSDDGTCIQPPSGSLVWYAGGVLSFMTGILVCVLVGLLSWILAVLLLMLRDSIEIRVHKLMERLRSTQAS